MTAHETAKRGVDLSLSLLAIVLLAPLFCLIGIVVAVTSSGPVIYRGKRLGRDQRVFTQYKFRTMVADAPDLRNTDGSTLSEKTDPRLTKFGRFLRKASLDELPQLFNVLQGTMSLVGPRPDPVNVIGLYRPQDFARLSVKPGLTGWAVVNGRNSIPWEKRRDLDLEYVNRQSLALDIKILIATLFLVLRREGVFSGESQ